ncbi:hypothetical protein DMN91_006596 [Ooceraea biroi]|uniref:Glutathione S-transferase 1-1 n=1 Tax=Ooceraea biroi TaxID=2015173 RepID=A0A3L8DP60_OOCBI|nr:hypothetical protein DMN91_006596 [Ooceraea biroi]
MPIDCYYLPPSPPCRTIVLLAKALGVHFNFKIVNVMSGDHMKAEYLQINPQHTIPTIDDNGFILWESRPIMIYLVSKYAKNDSLYPKDPKQKALVDQMIFFDAGSLYSNMGKCYLPVIKGLANSINEEDLKRVEKSFEVLNLFLEGRQFAAGENLSIADFTISTTICTILCFDFDISRYDNVAAYYERCKESLERYGFEEVHAVGVKAFTEIYHANLQESISLRVRTLIRVYVHRSSLYTRAITQQPAMFDNDEAETRFTAVEFSPSGSGCSKKPLAFDVQRSKVGYFQDIRIQDLQQASWLDSPCHNLACAPPERLQSPDFKMPIDLYHTAVSGPCRAVRLVAAAVGVDLNLKNIDLRAGEHMTPEFLKINPQHTVPTLNDNGFYLWESRAIMTYLVNQYGKNDSLYPKDPKKRALVDQRLYFDMGTLYQSLGNYYRPIILENATPDQAKYEKICDALSLLDKFLEGENYVAGKTLTIADFALAVNVNNVKALGFDINKYSNILKWHTRMETEIPKYKEIDVVGAKLFKDFIENMKKINVQLISLIPNMPVQLYYMNMSPPCRAVVLVAETIGLELELIEMNILNGEHLTPEYEQINPQKTIPFMIDDDLKLSESRAIMCYLADQYGQDNNLYPQTPEARAVVNQRLYFDMDPLLSSISASYYPVFKKLADTCDPAQYEKMVNAFQLLDKFLEGQDYVAGNNLTIADCAMVASVAAAESFGFDVGNFENVSKWLENIKTTVPGYEKAIAEPIEAFKKIYLENSQGEHEEEEEKEEEE